MGIRRVSGKGFDGYRWGIGGYRGYRFKVGRPPRQIVQTLLFTKTPKEHWCETRIQRKNTSILCSPFTIEKCEGAKCFIILKRKKFEGRIGAVDREPF